MLRAAEEAERSGSRDDARRALEAALSAATEAGDARSEAEVRRRLGNLACNAGRTAEGIAELARARELARAAGDRNVEGHALMNLATARSAGDLALSLAMLDEALEIAREIGDRALEAHVRHNAGTLYTGVGAFERAREHVEAALAIYREIGRSDGEGYCLSTLGGIANSLDEHERAVALLEAAVEIRRAQRDERSIALSLANLGRTRHRLGLLADARAALEESVALLERHDPRTTARILNFLADAAIDAGDLPAADAAVARALRLQGTTSDPDAAAQTLHTRTLLARARGDRRAAVAEARAAVAAVEVARRRLDRAADRTGYMAMGRECYDNLVEAVMDLAAEEPALADAALEASERSKARGLLDVLGRDTPRSPRPASALGERASALEARLDELVERRFRMLATGASADEERACRSELELLAAELDHAELRLEKAGTSAALEDARPLHVAEIRAQLLEDEGTRLVSFAVGEARSFVHGVSRSGTVHGILPGRARIGALVRAAVAGASSREGNATGALSELAALLLGPLGPLDEPRIVVVPDGPLHAVPFAALPHPGSGRPLGERHEIALLPSASALPVLRRRRQGRGEREPLLGIVADPVLHPADERLPPAVRAHARAAPAPGVPSGLGRLPFTGREAAAIAQRLPPERVTLLSGFDATLASFRRLAGGCDILHLATHGFQDAARADLSGIVLGLVGPDGLPVRGFVSTREVASLTLAADLVVLSGCRTAIGAEVAGEGIVGLPHAFLAAGAGRVLASLWPVDDVATAELMTLFYDGLLGRGEGPAAALAAAQRSLASRRRFAAPYFWAGFTLVGDWRP